MVCLDTDFLVNYIRHEPRAMQKLNELVEKREPIYTTLINAYELYKGVFRAKDAFNELAKVEKVLDAFFILLLDRDSARAAGAIDNRLKSSPIGESDLLISSIAITNKQTLITRNIKHYERVPDLKIESW